MTAWLALVAVGCLVGSQAAFGGVYCRDPGIDISSGTVTDDLVIDDHLTITDLNVRIVASHTFVGDLAFTLQKTAGDGAPISEKTLWFHPLDGAGDCIEDDVDLVLDDEASNGAASAQCESPLGAGGPYTPDQALSAFDGVDIAGTWRLSSTDHYVSFDGGTLTQWCLITLSALDIDGNGEVTALEDGILVLRYKFDFTGGLLTSGAVDTVNCTRCTSTAIETYLANLP